MTLIHTALLCEAQAIIEYFKLKKDLNNFYKNDQIIISISGIGKDNTTRCLKSVFNDFSIKKAINIGIAGCLDTKINIGEIFCVKGEFEGVKKASITSVNKATKDIKTLLVDMEFEAFKRECEKAKIPCYSFKIVSDYLDDTIPKKAFVTKLIRESLKSWIKLV